MEYDNCINCSVFRYLCSWICHLSNGFLFLVFPSDYAIGTLFITIVFSVKQGITVVSHCHDSTFFKIHVILLDLYIKYRTLDLSRFGNYDEFFLVFV